MMQKIRDSASGPLAYIVVGVITVVFGVWGIGSYFTPSADPAVASVGSTEITQSQLQRAFDQRYQRLRQTMGDNFDSSLFPPGQVRQDVLNSLVDSAAADQYARQSGYQVSNATLLATIRNNPSFQVNGQFSADRYRQLLSQVGMQPAQYEARLRQSLLGDQVRQLLIGTAFVVPPEVQTAYRQANAERDIRVLAFDPSAYRDQVDIGDEAIQSYYQAHQQAFMAPDRVKLAYVTLDANNLSSGQPSEQTLRSLYQRHESEFGQPEKRSAQVIRIPISDSDDSSARQAVQSLLSAARSQPDTSLEAVAGQSPEASYEFIDSQSASALPQALGDALFDLAEGALSNPVRGDDAWYLLRTTSVTPAETPSFDDPMVQNRLQAMAQQDAQAQAFREQSRKLGNLAYQAPNSLDTIADELDLSIQTTDWITRDGSGGPSGIGQYQAVRQAAFSDAVLQDHLNSDVLSIGEQRAVVLRVAEHQASEVRPLSAVRDQIRERLVGEAAQKRARQAAEAAMKQAREGQSLRQIAESQGPARLLNPGYIQRDDQSLDSGWREAAFAMPAPENESATTYRVATSGDGQPGVIAVSDQRIAETGDAGQGDTQRQQIAQQQQRLNAMLEYATFNNYVRDQVDVQIHRDSLQPGQTGDAG